LEIREILPPNLAVVHEAERAQILECLDHVGLGNLENGRATLAIHCGHFVVGNVAVDIIHKREGGHDGVADFRRVALRADAAWLVFGGSSDMVRETLRVTKEPLRGRADDVFGKIKAVSVWKEQVEPRIRESRRGDQCHG
jgi:hypothetical protein